ncbi:MAG TPA: hypothetical protein DDZ39_04890, partial [Flavobacteriaceae bacterium]|nr:hypothetical protein [Flavobacteriaceae bacterium]
LSFLKGLCFLEELFITMYGNENINFSFLLNLINVRSLGIHVHKKKSIIDLVNNSNLEFFSFEYFDKNTTVNSLENCLKLKEISLSEYHLDTLENLGKLKILESLTIKSSKLRSLKGIENFINLKYLYVGGIRRLKSISAINEMQNLEEVVVDGCRQINDFELLTEIP